jgi:hypothetical protein
MMEHSHARTGGGEAEWDCWRTTSRKVGAFGKLFSRESSAQRRNLERPSEPCPRMNGGAKGEREEEASDVTVIKTATDGLVCWRWEAHVPAREGSQEQWRSWWWSLAPEWPPVVWGSRDVAATPETAAPRAVHG